jgi:RecG-like helicase
LLRLWLRRQTKRGEATVEDLLSYLPMRYEIGRISHNKDLEAGMEATLELQVKHAGGSGQK